ncbi:MAG TPA: outer membrane beta-barrel protein [Xanthobacteraceae bacterium]|nr:outer membrane beta-barrel protein [Xanthobacteraceae bacterium]
MSVRVASLFASVAAVTCILNPATAADLAAKKAIKAPPPVAVWDWTGLYAGGYAGLGIQRSHGSDPTGATGPGEVEFIGAGAAAGGTLGYNYQIGPAWLIGIEGDFGYLGLDRKFTDYFPDQNFNSKSSWIGTLRGRVGYTGGGPTLSYLTGGAAWVHFTDVNDGSRFGNDVVESSLNSSGYTWGTGTETRLGGNWTAKAEYLFVDVGDGDLLTSPNVRGPEQVDKHRYQLVKYGVNYLFGGRPEPALPPHNWSGAFAGIIGGSAVTSTRGSDPTGAVIGDINNNGSGFSLGGLAGFNWQISPTLVAGVEGDIDWLGIDHDSHDYFDNPSSLGVKTDWMATARARFGYSTGPALLYVTGGAAWINVRDSFQGSASLGGGPLVSSSKTLAGAAFGGGIESPFLLPGWTTRSEYLFVDVGHGDTLQTGGDSLRADHDFHLFRTALLRKF